MSTKQPTMLNGLTASEPSYRDKAQKLLDAAHDFWQSSSPRVAVRWLSASDDALVIFTRGEYRETLMSNIDKLPGESVTWLIGEADEGPELRYGQRAASETAETASVAGLSLTDAEIADVFREVCGVNAIPADFELARAILAAAQEKRDGEPT